LQFADIFSTSCRRYAFEGDKYGVETSFSQIAPTGTTSLPSILEKSIFEYFLR
jgi:hypothetical protein